MTQAALLRPEDKLDTLRRSCAWVAGQAEHVKIHAGKIPDYARFIFGKYPVITGMDEPHHFSSPDDEETAAYVLALDSVNFGSGYFRETGLEYDKVAGGLKDAFLRGEMNTAEKWRVATAEDCARLFRPTGRAEGLMELFAGHLNETGRIICDEYDGRVLNLLSAAGGSASRLVDIISEWKTFRDVAVYKGRPVPFLKRAQIFAAHLFLTMKGRGGTDFKDMDALAIFADNMVPHVLRHDGILEYSPALSAKIDAGTGIEPQSPEEVEIRACAIHAVELMSKSSGAMAVSFDHILWNRGYEPEIYAGKLHQTKTVWY